MPRRHTDCLMPMQRDLSHLVAGPHNLSVRGRNIRLFPSLEYDSNVADILSGRPERVSAKKGPPPSHCGLKFWLVTTLRRARSLRSLKQALRLTPPAKFSPFGHRPPFQWAGSCTNAYVLVFRRCGFIHIAKCFSALCADSNATRAREVCWCGPTSFENLHRMPVEDLCRRFASPLFVVVVRRRCSGGRVISLLLHTIGIFVSHAFACIPCAMRYYFIKKGPTYLEYLFRRMWVCSCVCDT